MKKLLYTIGVILIVLTVGCTSDEGTVINNNIVIEDKNTTNNSTQNNSNTEINNKETYNIDIKDKQVISQKHYYLSKLNELEIKEYNYMINENPQTTLEIMECTNNMYNMWDDLLNDIWGVLKEQLSSNEMKELTFLEKQWIKDKESDAEEAMNQYEGGTEGQIEYYSSLLNSTKERCYYLVENYMK